MRAPEMDPGGRQKPTIVPITVGRRYAEYEPEFVERKAREGLTLLEVDGMRTDITDSRKGRGDQATPTARAVNLEALRRTLASVDIQLQAGEKALEYATFGQIDNARSSAPLFVWADISKATASARDRDGPGRRGQHGERAGGVAA